MPPARRRRSQPAARGRTFLLSRLARPAGCVGRRRTGQPLAQPRPAVAFGRFLRCAAAAVAMLGAGHSHGLYLEYQAFIAGTRAGTAQVHIERDAGRYAVHGAIATQGLWHRLAPWRARFAVDGWLQGGLARPVQLGLQEWARRKERTIHVAKGTLRQLRNGRLRPQRPAPPGVDIVSALWAGGQCQAEQVLNNGRHVYAMTRRRHRVRGDGSERCDYDIVDDDGGRFRGWVELGERHGWRVPLEIGRIDGVTSRLALVSAALSGSGAESASGADTLPWNVAAAARAVTPALP